MEKLPPVIIIMNKKTRTLKYRLNAMITETGTFVNLHTFKRRVKRPEEVALGRHSLPDATETEGSGMLTYVFSTHGGGQISKSELEELSESRH